MADTLLTFKTKAERERERTLEGVEVTDYRTAEARPEDIATSLKSMFSPDQLDRIAEELDND